MATLLSANWTILMVALPLAALIGTACGGQDVSAPKASNSGDVVWSVEAKSLRLTPVADSSRVYFGSLNHRVTAVNLNTGQSLWTQTITAPSGGLAGFSFGSVLVLAG